MFFLLCKKWKKFLTYKLGCRYAISLSVLFQTGLVINQKFSKYTKQEFLANKHTALSWFRSFKAFVNRHDGRTYTQVLSAHSKSQSLSHRPLDGNQRIRMIAISRKNANAKLVTPSKVGMKICRNVSPGIKDCVQVHLQSPQIKPSKHDNLLLLQNRSELLEQFPDNVSHFTSPDARETGQELHKGCTHRWEDTGSESTQKISLSK